MVLNTVYQGDTYDATSMWKTGDAYFKFTLPSAGVISISMSHDIYDSESEGWYLSLEDSKYQIVYDMYSSIGIEHMKDSPQIGVPAGTYYICVSDRGAHNFNQFYFGLCVKYEKTNNWETEFNNSWFAADNIMTDVTYSGVTLDRDDAYEGDYYKFNVPYSCSVIVSFWHELFDWDHTWDIEIYNANRQKVNSFCSKNGYSRDVAYKELDLTKGTYYLVIKNNYYSDEVPYHFNVNIQPPIGTIATIEGLQYKILGYGISGSKVECMGPTSKNIKNVTIKSTVKIDAFKYIVTEIKNGAFQNCKKLKKVTIGSNVKKIGSKAFYGCKKLKSVTIKSKKITSIKSRAFKGIYKKAKNKVPSSKKTKYKKLLKKAGVKSTAIIK